METVQGGGTEKSLNPPAWNSAQESSLASNSHQELENTGMNSEILLAWSKASQEQRRKEISSQCFYQLCQQRTMTVQYTSPRVCLGPADSFAPFHLKREKENSKGETRGAGLGESAFIQSLQALLQLRGMPQLGKPVSSQPHFFSFQHIMEDKCI